MGCHHMGKKACNDIRHAGYVLRDYRYVDDQFVHPDSHIKIGEEC